MQLALERATGRAKLEEFIEALDLKYFTAAELLIHTDRPWNALPPSELWPNIAPTAKLLDEVREHFARPVVITSCYRAPDYNRRIGGAPLSQHQAFTAVDFAVSGVPPKRVAAFLRGLREGGHWIDLPEHPKRMRLYAPAGPVPFAELPTRASGGPAVRFAGGVAAYPSFTHLDTRGLNANWG
ncbi:MAG TPA: D-Ala-D-Ala carboxypeptidase family metallohydrolase [Thermoanaerobaculia bacterium]